MENQHLISDQDNSDYYSTVETNKKKYNSGMTTLDKYKARYFPVLPTDENINRTPLTDDEDLLKDYLEDQDKYNAIVLLQSYIRKYNVKILYNKLVMRDEHRILAIKEIVNTEESYCQSLKQLIGLFLSPLESISSFDDGFITKQDVEKIFLNVKTIYDLNVEFLALLKERTKTIDKFTKIGDIFVYIGSFFKLYSVYCQQYESSVSHVSYLMKNNSQFSQFLEDINPMKDDEHDLMSYLIMPVQRTPRYILLLTSVLSNTYDEHPDKENLEKALAICKNVADHINEALKLVQQVHSLIKIEKKFNYNLKLVDPARRFIKEGNLHKITSRIIVEPTYYLFNDILIYAYADRYKGTIDLGPCWIRNLEDTDRFKNLFQIITPKKTYTLFANSKKEKDEWINALNSVIDKLVEINPELITMRSKKVLTTVRFGQSFWNLITKDIGRKSIDSDVEKDYKKYVGEEIERIKESNSPYGGVKLTAIKLEKELNNIKKNKENYELRRPLLSINESEDDRKCSCCTIL